MKNRIMKDIGNVVEILYNLDIYLSNSYTGNKDNQIDISINAIRIPIKKALNNLNSKNWIKHLK